MQGAPVFTVEVRREGDYGLRAEREMMAKRADYFAAGTAVVWDVDVLGEEVIRVYRSTEPESPVIYRRGETAEAEPAVPGWRFEVNRLFRVIGRRGWPSNGLAYLNGTPMRRLPLFPLPVVLFPGGPMPLHIFEPRYRQMMAHCVEGDRTFGLVYHDPDRAGPYIVEPGHVGCTARVLNFQPLPDGRSLVLVRGGERFEVEDGIESPNLYWECVAVPYADADAPEFGLAEHRRRSIGLFHQVLERIVRHPRPFPEIDAEEETAFQLAQAIRVDPAWQQRLLELRSERERLDQVDHLLRSVLEAGPDDDGDD